jgi:hypothetical protein
MSNANIGSNSVYGLLLTYAMYSMTAICFYRSPWTYERR